ncbi:MAG: hypothetical protein AAGL10_14105 [Pseudomonadota bacterium]
MQITFLIGGTGNQFFQFATSRPDAKMSTVFLQQSVRKILGWTQHEQVINYDGAGLFKTALAFAILGFDIALAKIAKVSLFTEFDTRGLKLEPKISPIVRLGYFQEAQVTRSLAEIGRQIAPTPQQGLLAMHVRGGDLLRLEQAGKNEYGMLDNSYYRSGIEKVRDKLASEDRNAAEVLVLTDDPEYAATQNFSIDGMPEPVIKRVPLKETLALAVGAEWFISSNSTMSYWIIQLREGQRTFAPQPFQKRRDYDVHTAAQRVRFEYK